MKKLTQMSDNMLGQFRKMMDIDACCQNLTISVNGVAYRAHPG